jgi:hypothetical protein
MGNSTNFLVSKLALANYLVEHFSEFKSKGYAQFCQKTENVLLAFDVIKCPFFDSSTRLAFARAIVEMRHANNIVNRAKALFETIQGGDWFYRWDGLLDLRTVLLKKELRSAY